MNPVQNLTPPRTVPRNDLIRQRYRDIFGRDTLLDDTCLARRFTVSDDGELIMILR